MKLVPALGTELNLARCWTAIGRFVDAVRLYKDLQAKLANQKQPQREQLVKDGLAAAMSKIGHLSITYVSTTPNPNVKIDGRPVEIDDAVEVDPGRHTVTADGAKPAEVTIDVGDNKAIALEALPVVATKSSSGKGVLAYTAAGAGGALVIGALTGIITLRQRNAGRDRCTADDSGQLVCDARGVELLSHARTTAHVSTGFFVTGAALATITALLYLQARPEKAPATTPTVWVTPTGGGLAMERAW